MATDDIRFSDLIASSVHDMKNSLNLQVNALEKIAARLQEQGNSATCADLGRVIYQANRMNLSLVEMLALYKMGKALYPVDKDEHAVAEVIAEAVLQNRSMMDLQGFTTTVECAPDLYWYLDRELIRGVLLNALNNAYHYTRDKIHVVAAVQDRQLLLRVEDNGPGYPNSMLQKDGLDAERGVDFGSGSTGLGFYFSTQVARLHRNGGRQGTLRIENGGTWGGGCFVLCLP